MQQADDRKQCLALAEEAGLDVARITKLVVENIRSADSVELSMDMQLLQQTATTEVWLLPSDGFVNMLQAAAIWWIYNSYMWEAAAIWWIC